jgi:hypothetical protein
MLKKIFNLFKKIIISAFALYGYNLIVSPTGLIVPINIITISILTILGLPSLLFLIIILVIVF